MPQKGKISPEEKVAAVEAYLDGEIGTAKIIDKHGIAKSTFILGSGYIKHGDRKGLSPQQQTANMHLN